MNFKNWFKNSWYTDYLVMIVCAFFYAFTILVFLQPAKTFMTGMTVFAQLIIFSTGVSNMWFSSIYTLINIPLIIIFYILKTDKKFLLRTITFLLFLNLFNYVLSLYNFSELNPLEATIVDHYISPHSYELFISVIIASIIISFVASLSYKFNGSTAGTDFIIFYISNKKGKSIGKYALMFSLFTLVFSIILLNISLEGKSFVKSFLGTTTFATLIYITLFSIVVNSIYPRYKKVKISIVTNVPDKISKLFKEIKYQHAWTIQEVTGGYSNSKKYKVETIILYLKHKSIIKEITNLDKGSFIYLENISGVFGNFSLK